MSPLNMNEPIFDVAQLAHVELLTPDLEGTLNFFRDLLGAQETERRGQSVYLRGYEEQYHHSLKVTAASHPGLGHVAWRARSPQALARRVAAIEATGLGRGWIDGDEGHGRAYRFNTPEGHPMELLWDVDYVTAAAGKETPLRNRPQKRPRTGLLPLHLLAAPLRSGGTGKRSRHRDRTRTRPAWHRRGVVSLHAGAGGQSHRTHGRSRLHDFRSGLEDRGLEGIGGSHCRRCLDRLAFT
jgi:catechol 2,3-dioxygenase-like lactoylglutathione lyase family enzyme